MKTNCGGAQLLGPWLFDGNIESLCESVLHDVFRAVLARTNRLTLDDFVHHLAGLIVEDRHLVGDGFLPRSLIFVVGRGVTSRRRRAQARGFLEMDARQQGGSLSLGFFRACN